MEKPKFVYHYTNWDSGITILKSRTLRMYEAMSQSDPFEIIFGARSVYNVVLKLIDINNTKLSKLKKATLINLLTAFAYYFSKGDFGKEILNAIKTIDKTDEYRKFYEILLNRKIQFFLTSFSENERNKYLWKNYADNNKGMVFEFKVDYLPETVGIKKVHYSNNKSNEDLIDFVINYRMNEFRDPMTTFFSVIKASTDHILSAKEDSFKIEKEYRLIEQHDSGERALDILNDGNRDFVLLPINKSQFAKRVTNVFITEMVSNQMKHELNIVLENYKNSKVTKLLTEKI